MLSLWVGTTYVKKPSKCLSLHSVSQSVSHSLDCSNTSPVATRRSSLPRTYFPAPPQLHIGHAFHLFPSVRPARSRAPCEENRSLPCSSQSDRLSWVYCFSYRSLLNKQNQQTKELKKKRKKRNKTNTTHCPVINAYQSSTFSVNGTIGPSAPSSSAPAPLPLEPSLHSSSLPSWA